MSLNPVAAPARHHTSRKTSARIVGAVFALSLGLVACNSASNTTTPVVSDGTYVLVVNYTGLKGPQNVVITAANGTARTFNMQSGAGIYGLKGIYTVTMPGAASNNVQTVDLTSANQTISFAF